MFFQAEDGIRDIGVTGVQTCALPISGRAHVDLPSEGLDGPTSKSSWRTIKSPRDRFPRPLGSVDDPPLATRRWGTARRGDLSCREDSEIGRGSCREKGEISVVAVSLKKKHLIYEVRRDVK